MRRKLSLLLMLTAWLFATGAQWDLVQTFAWGRMFVSNSSAMPLLAAVEKTFSPDATCSLCAAVQEAKQQQQGTPFVPDGKFVTKLFLTNAPVGLTWIAPTTSDTTLSAEVRAPRSAEPSAPPSPPPRILG